MASDNIVTRFIKANQGDGVSPQTTRELMRLGIHPSQTTAAKTAPATSVSPSSPGRTQEQEFARVLGEEALRRRMVNQAAQKQMLLRKMQQSQQQLQLQQAVTSGEEEPADDEVVKAIQSAVQNMQQRRN